MTVDLDDADATDAIARGALGLTLAEAENAFARAMANDNALDAADIPVVLDEKRQIVRRSGVLEVVTSTIRLDDVGGLANLKKWLVKRTGAWTAEAARYGLPAPKGVLVTGVPGCGKSMTAKAMASAWSIPLIRLDIGKVFAGLVGASRGEHAQGAGHRRGDRAVRAVDRRDREGLRVGVRASATPGPAPGCSARS